MEKKLEIWFNEMYNLNDIQISKEIDTLKNELRIKHLEIYNLELRLFSHHLMKNIKHNKEVKAALQDTIQKMSNTIQDLKNTINSQKRIIDFLEERWSEEVGELKSNKTFEEIAEKIKTQVELPKESELVLGSCKLKF